MNSSRAFEGYRTGLIEPRTGMPSTVNSQNGRYTYVELGKGGNMGITAGNRKEGSCPFGSLKDFSKIGILY
jgi:hypothetical protein